MKFNETWLLAFALVASGSAGGCYVDTPKHEVADAEAIREAARAEAGVEPQDDAEAEDAGASDAGRDAGALADAGESDADTCACDEGLICLEDAACVTCTADAGCDEGRLCDTASDTCVGCKDNTQCMTASASLCTDDKECGQCTSDSDCSHIDGKGVCSDGACVECTRADRTACPAVGNKTTTCDSATNSCTGTPVGSVLRCGVCLSDDDCETGTACVGTQFSGVAIPDVHYCLPIRVTACDQQQPFLTGSSLVTADGDTREMCTLAVSTCAAQADFKNKFCGVDMAGQLIPTNGNNPPLPIAHHGDNSLCGQPGVADGYCVQTALNSGTYRCTVACSNGTLGDCPDDSTACALTSHQTASRYLCRF